ncbi:MAG: TolC family protein [Bacteroidales bacterium]|nr:TolC family protein [Bacteroidales bacterium]
MRFLIIIISAFFAVVPVLSQSVSLEECTKAANDEFPLTRNLDIVIEKYKRQQDIINLNYLPGMSLNALGNYQSDVVSFDLGIDIPGMSFPEVPHLQFRNTIDVNQLVYDGGVNTALKSLNSSQLEIQKTGIRNRQFQLRLMVEDIYMAILQTKGQIPIIDLHINNLESSRDEVQKLVNEGVLIQTSVDQINAKLIDSKHIKQQTRAKLTQLIAQMNELANMSLDMNWSFEIPQPEVESKSIVRGEVQLIDHQKNLLEGNQYLLSRANYPKIGAFGQLGYGRPGLNFLNDQWDSFFIAGIKFSWTFWDWKKTKKQNANLGLQSKMLDNEKDAFLKQLNLGLIEQRSAIFSINQSILKELELIKLYDRILASSSQQLKEGVITLNTHLQNLNASKLSRQNLVNYKVQLVRAKQRLVTLTGN